MVNHKTDYEVGNTVCILDASKIEGGCKYWKTGDVTEVIEVSSKGRIRLRATVKGANCLGNFLYKDELKFIRLVEDSTQELSDFLLGLKDKIKSLERRVEELENKPNEDDVLNVTSHFAVEDKLNNKELASKINEILKKHDNKEKLSSNELRKQVIKEAKEFIEENEPFAQKIDINVGEDIKIKSVKTVKYEVDAKNKKVVCKRAHIIILGKNESSAKCLPSDVFNVHIGKAIALGRLLGLDVSKFENTVQPDKLIEGMTVKSNADYPYSYIGYRKGDLFKVVSDNYSAERYECHVESDIGNNSSIAEDSNARY